MPVTKTAKRALRITEVKTAHNKELVSRMEIALRTAKKTKSKTDVSGAVSLVDRARKHNILHKNKAARMKSQLSRATK